MSDIDSRNRKPKKGKNKVEEPNLGSKRKRGQKSMSVTPSIADDEDEDHDSVRPLQTLLADPDIHPTLRNDEKKLVLPETTFRTKPERK